MLSHVEDKLENVEMHCSPNVPGLVIFNTLDKKRSSYLIGSLVPHV